jgi:hypothetical protein
MNGSRSRVKVGRLILHCLSNETVWVDGNPVVISDKLIDSTEGRSFVRFGASIRIQRDGYQNGQRLQRLVIEAPRSIQIERDSVRQHKAIRIQNGEAQEASQIILLPRWNAARIRTVRRSTGSHGLNAAVLPLSPLRRNEVRAEAASTNSGRTK